MKKVYAVLVMELFIAAILWGADNGGYEMKKRLEPLKIKSSQKISGISGIALQNHLAGINDKGEFTIIEIDEKKEVKIKVVVPHFPPFDGWELRSDNEYNVIWKTRGRGFYAVDTDTKRTGHCVASNDGDDKVVHTQLIDPGKKIFMIELSRLGPGLSGLAGFIHVLYDLNQDKIIYTSPLYDGGYYRFDQKYILFSEFSGEHHDIINWYFIDKENKKIENKLTKKMNQMQIDMWFDSKCMSVKNRIILGTNQIENTTAYYSVRWDEKFGEIKIEPIILQRPDGNFMDEAFDFSGNGKWVKTLRFPNNNGREMPPELIFFHVSDIYPQGLSMPILCGYTSAGMPGAYMEHSKLGMCYVQLTGYYTLEVYVLNDGLQLLAEDAGNTFAGR